ncbi:hypothetical protein Tco_0795772 [Tanacetum coccineum]
MGVGSYKIELEDVPVFLQSHDHLLAVDETMTAEVYDSIGAAGQTMMLAKGGGRNPKNGVWYGGVRRCIVGLWRWLLSGVCGVYGGVYCGVDLPLIFRVRLDSILMILVRFDEGGALRHGFLSDVGEELGGVGCTTGSIRGSATVCLKVRSGEGAGRFKRVGGVGGGEKVRGGGGFIYSGVGLALVVTVKWWRSWGLERLRDGFLSPGAVAQKIKNRRTRQIRSIEYREELGSKKQELLLTRSSGDFTPLDGAKSWILVLLIDGIHDIKQSEGYFSERSSRTEFMIRGLLADVAWGGWCDAFCWAKIPWLIRFSWSQHSPCSWNLGSVTIICVGVANVDQMFGVCDMCLGMGVLGLVASIELLPAGIGGKNGVNIWPVVPPLPCGSYAAYQGYWRSDLSLPQSTNGECVRLSCWFKWVLELIIRDIEECFIIVESGGVSQRMVDDWEDS